MRSAHAAIGVCTPERTITGDVVRLEQSWCPNCCEWSVIDAGRPCVFCDTPLVKRKGGWKRPDRYTFTRRELELIAETHARDISLRTIARKLWRKRGYSSEHSCLGVMLDALHREGLYVRSHGEATAQANRARSKRLPGEDKNAYKRRRRREYGYHDSRTGEWKRIAV